MLSAIRSSAAITTTSIGVLSATAGQSQRRRRQQDVEFYKVRHRTAFQERGIQHGADLLRAFG